MAITILLTMRNTLIVLIHNQINSFFEDIKRHYKVQYLKDWLDRDLLQTKVFFVGYLQKLSNSLKGRNFSPEDPHPNCLGMKYFIFWLCSNLQFVYPWRWDAVMRSSHKYFSYQSFCGFVNYIVFREFGQTPCSF